MRVQPLGAYESHHAEKTNYLQPWTLDLLLLRQEILFNINLIYYYLGLEVQVFYFFSYQEWIFFFQWTPNTPIQYSYYQHFISLTDHKLL